MNTPATTMNVSPQSRSALVTVLAWLGIGMGVLTLCSALSQYLFFEALAETPATGMDPAVQDGLFRGFQGITLINLAIAGFFIYTGYSLWKRRNWARVTYIVLFAIGIGGNVIGVAMATMFSSLFAQLGAGFGPLFVVIALFSLGVIALFAWFIKRLRSPAVKGEFA
jgi:hypothetical protein